MVSEPRRSLSVPSSTHCDGLVGHAFAHERTEDAGLLPIEIAFQTVADGLVEQDARPARTEYHVGLACGCGPGVQQHQRLPQGLVDVVGPGPAIEEHGVSVPPPGSVGSAFHPIADAHYDAHVEAHEWPDVARRCSAGSDDADQLVRSRQCG